MRLISLNDQNSVILNAALINSHGVPYDFSIPGYKSPNWGALPPNDRTTKKWKLRNRVPMKIISSAKGDYFIPMHRYGEFIYLSPTDDIRFNALFFNLQENIYNNENDVIEVLIENYGGEDLDDVMAKGHWLDAFEEFISLAEFEFESTQYLVYSKSDMKEHIENVLRSDTLSYFNEYYYSDLFHMDSLGPMIKKIVERGEERLAQEFLVELADKLKVWDNICDSILKLPSEEIASIVGSEYCDEFDLFGETWYVLH